MQVGRALIGFVLGALAGLLAALLFVFLWYDVLAIGDHGADGLSGAATGMMLAPALALAGGLAGAFWLGRSAGSRRGGLTIALLALLLIVVILLILGPAMVF